MKFPALFFAIALACPAARAFDHSSFDGVLQKFVDSEGLVAYADLKANRGPLDQYLAETGAVTKGTFQTWSENEQLAFLINLYNAETLQLIIDHYPTASIKKLGGLFSSPWDQKTVVLFGEEVTLNHLEHEVIRVDFADEPRIHFALVCAAIGCPPLRNEAYLASQLEVQLDDQARTFLNRPSENRIEGDTLYLSSIFKWYGEDFTRTGKSLNDYVAPYIQGDPAGKAVKFTSYDWSLNEQ